MARPKKPWRRGENGPWYCWVGKKCMYVADKDKSYAEAWDAFIANYSAPPANKITVKVVLNRYLNWAEANLKASTHTWHQGFLTRFSETIHNNLKVCDLKKFQIQEWLDKEKTWSSTTRNRAVASLRAAFNWAMQLELIDYNPAAGFKAPSRSRGRELWLDDTEFKRLLTFVTEDCFRDYLTFAFETGARPQEIRILTAKHWDGDKFILSIEESKGEKMQRVIYCNKRMQRLVIALVKLNPDGPIFLNQDGKPWKPNAVRSRFKRRAKKKGQPAIGLAPKMGLKGLCAYTMRHSFCTNALIRGLDVVTVAALMGHKDATMVMRVYQHLAKDHAHLLKAANRATVADEVVAGLEIPVLSLPAPGMLPVVPALL